VVNRQEDQSVSMRDIIEETIADIIAEIEEGRIESVTEFEGLLSELGFMIVPIEDPTNLRFGVDE
jgi:hypothetical protein